MFRNNLILILCFLAPLFISLKLSSGNVNYLTGHHDRPKRFVDTDLLNKTIFNLIELWTVKRIPPNTTCYNQSEETNLLEKRGLHLSKLTDPSVSESDLTEVEAFLKEYINGIRCNDKNAYCSITKHVCVCRAFRFDTKKYKPAEPLGDDCVLTLDHPCDYSFDFKCQDKQRCLLYRDDVLCSKDNNDVRDKACGGKTAAHEVDCKCSDINAKQFSISYNETSPPRIPDCTGYQKAKSFGIRTHRIEMGVTTGMLNFVVFLYRFQYESLFY